MADQVKQTSRAFTATKDDSTEVQLRVREATRRELEMADMEFSRAFNMALRFGLPTSTRQMKHLKQSELWTEADDARVQKLRQHALAIEDRLSEAGDTASEDLKTEHREAMTQLNEARRDLEAMLAHTCDAKADQAYRNFLMCCSVEVVGDEKAERLWPSVDDLMQETDNKLLSRAMYEWTMFRAGLESDWASFQTPAPATATTQATDQADQTEPDAPAQVPADEPSAIDQSPDPIDEPPADEPDPVVQVAPGVASDEPEAGQLVSEDEPVEQPVA